MVALLPITKVSSPEGGDDTFVSQLECYSPPLFPKEEDGVVYADMKQRLHQPLEMHFAIAMNGDEKSQANEAAFMWMNQVEGHDLDWTYYSV